MGTGSSALESQDSFVITCEISEQVEEIEDNRNLLHPLLLLSYMILDSSAIAYEPSFFLHNNFIDIEKPPIIS